MEAMDLQAQIDEEKRKQAEEKLLQEQEVEKKRRSKDKEQVGQVYFCFVFSFQVSIYCLPAINVECFQKCFWVCS